ncbi:unnamed protein product [Effrenium voratum]|nr:unnamed protein product [Effrenium voratum]
MMFGRLALLAGLSFAAGEVCANCEQVSLLQSKTDQKTQRSHSIVVKGPDPSGGTASQSLAPTCAEGFNAAYLKCLGGANSYLMLLVTNDDDTKAYCAYTGGWAQTPENYPDHSACFASPGESEALFFDSASQTLLNWDKETIVSGPLKQDYTSLSCTGQGDAPCKSTVENKYARQLTKGGKPWKDVPAGGEYSFSWDSSDGYIGVTTKTPQTIYSMYIKNNLGSSSSSGLSADVPCSKDSSVEWQAKNFPVKGLDGGCQKDNDDYWMAFGSSEITICFPGVAC